MPCRSFLLTRENGSIREIHLIKMSDRLKQYARQVSRSLWHMGFEGRGDVLQFCVQIQSETCCRWHRSAYFYPALVRSLSSQVEGMKIR
jgi:hypothetical protein